MAQPRGSRLLTARDWRAAASSFELTTRQLEIVKAIFDDRTEAEMAKQIGLSYNTIHTHVKRLYRKFKVHSRSGLVIRVLFNNGELR